MFTNTNNRNAPTGLALPAAPFSGCAPGQAIEEVSVNSTDAFNAAAAGSCKRITLVPQSAPRTGFIQITGQDIEAVLTGNTITPATDTAALQIIHTARRVKTIGGTFNNNYLIGGHLGVGTWPNIVSVPQYVEDVHVYGASFTGMYTQGLVTSHWGDGAVISAHRFLLERSSVRAANGGFFVEPQSSNLILANSSIVVPKLPERHENPVRINGSDLIVLIDSRLRTELAGEPTGLIKHTWRMHGSADGAGGRIIVKRVQSEGGGATAHYPGEETANQQSSHIVVDGWRYYRAPSVIGNDVAAIPHLNTYESSAYRGTVMNAWLWMNDNIVYYTNDTYPDYPVPGSPIMTSNVPLLGSVNSSVYAPYVAPPAWSFR